MPVAVKTEIVMMLKIIMKSNPVFDGSDFHC